MYYRLEDISGHVWRGHFDRLMMDGGRIILFDVDGYPIHSVPLSDVKAFSIE